MKSKSFVIFKDLCACVKFRSIPWYVHFRKSKDNFLRTDSLVAWLWGLASQPPTVGMLELQLKLGPSLLCFFLFQFLALGSRSGRRMRGLAGVKSKDNLWSYLSFTFIPRVKLRLSNLYSKHFNLLSHVSNRRVFCFVFLSFPTHEWKWGHDHFLVWLRREVLL